MNQRLRDETQGAIAGSVEPIVSERKAEVRRMIAELPNVVEVPEDQQVHETTITLIGPKIS